MADIRSIGSQVSIQESNGDVSLYLWSAAAGGLRLLLLIALLLITLPLIALLLIAPRGLRLLLLIALSSVIKNSHRPIPLSLLLIAPRGLTLLRL